MITSKRGWVQGCEDAVVSCRADDACWLHVHRPSATSSTSAAAGPQHALWAYGASGTATARPALEWSPPHVRYCLHLDLRPSEVADCAAFKLIRPSCHCPRAQVKLASLRGHEGNITRKLAPGT